MSFSQKKSLAVNTMDDLNIAYGEYLNAVKRKSPSLKISSNPEYITYYNIYSNKVSVLEPKNTNHLKSEIEAENQQAAKSKLSDVDLASEMTNVTINMIVRQARLALYAQGNFVSQNVLRLLG